jgi:hypothetical protein
MTLEELASLRVVERTDRSIMRATWFEDDDPMYFETADGKLWTLHQTAAGEWVRTRKW